MHRFAKMPLLLALALAPSAAGSGEPWAYRVGEPMSARQANFCERREHVDELADIFARFGPRTGFSALSASPGCAIEVRAVTPRELVRSVRVPLDGGGSYDVNFIRVITGSEERYLVTTRRLVE